MPYFGNRSESNLAEVHPDLIQVCRFVIEVFDFTVLCGYRGETEQNAAYPKYTKVKYPDSKHNRMPSEAVDIIPYDSIKKSIVPWKSDEEFSLLAGHMMMAAYAFNIKIRWGHDWNRNGILWDEAGKLIDRPHFELIS
jgi:peptidoglycan L-alanyl-D-glutamate endopeptidase CwlK